ncbi:MAG: pld [Gemmataceae bacterium]|nr:pld [Gemmataceae bacterium]
MNAADAERFLAQSIADLTLSGTEKQALTAWLAENARTDHLKGVVRHAAFELARKSVEGPAATRVVEWLEDVMRAIVPVERTAPAGASAHGDDAAFFSPGEGCWQHIVHCLHAARETADLCVFTITDDRISRAVLDTHRRRVRVRVITDAEKANDLGSDIGTFRDAGIAVKVIHVASPADPGLTGHMHHKFAIFDGHQMVNGSYNWTRGAAGVNYENVVDTTDPKLVARFAAEFERLWNKF